MRHDRGRAAPARAAEGLGAREEVSLARGRVGRRELRGRVRRRRVDWRHRARRQAPRIRAAGARPRHARREQGARPPRRLA